MKATVTAFCVLTAVLSLLSLISRKGSTEKCVRFVFSLVFALSLISVISDADFSSLPDFKATEEYTAEGGGTANAVSEKIVGTILRENGIDYERIEAECSTDEFGNVTVEKVTVYTDCDGETVKKTITENTVIKEVETVG